MKWPAEQVAILDSGFSQVLEKCGHTAEELRAQYAGLPPLALVYNVYRKVWMDTQDDDNHPRYRDGVFDDGREYKAAVRYVAYNPKFVLYPPGCNDTHLQTVLKTLGKKYNLILG
jgi:hypothetical protein